MVKIRETLSETNVNFYLNTHWKQTQKYKHKMNINVKCSTTLSAKKNKTPISCPQLHQILTDFQTFFQCSKFATTSCLNVPLCLKHVGTLPCEIWMSEKWRQSDIYIVINDKSQGSIAKHLRNGAFFTTHLSLNVLVKEFLKLVNIWRSYRHNGDCFTRPVRTALLSSKMLISSDNLNSVCITNRNCY